MPVNDDGDLCACRIWLQFCYGQLENSATLN